MGLIYVEAGERYYEEKYEKHILALLHKYAAFFGYCCHHPNRVNGQVVS